MAGQAWVKFFVGDWRRDPDVSLMSAEARGVWLELLWVMHEKDTCELSGTTKELARLARCEVDEIERAIKEIKRHNVADVSGDISGTCPPFVSIVSRRRLAENKEREYERDKKRRQRLTASKEPEETSLSLPCPVIVPLSDSDSDSSLLLINDKRSDFEERFWDVYAKKVGRKNADKKWSLLTEKTKALIDDHLPRFVRATPDPKFRPDPATYLNSERWLDEDLPNPTKRNEHGKSEKPLTKTDLGGLGLRDFVEYGYGRSRPKADSDGLLEIIVPYERDPKR